MSIAASRIFAAVVSTVAIATAAPALAQAQNLPSRGTVMSREPEAFRMPVAEVRGMWVVRSSITSPEKIKNVVTSAKKYGFNTLFVQVRGRGDAYYKSSFEPRSEELAAQPESFDPLADVITLAHASNIQVHAWVNTDFVWAGSKRPQSPMHIVNAHPEWIARLCDGTYSTTATDKCEGVFVSPVNPEVRQHNHDVFIDIVKNYDVDGIHFDYIRYPNTAYDYSAAAKSAFCAYMSGNGYDAPPEAATEAAKLDFIQRYADLWADWRRQQVTTMVESISHDAKAIKPGIVVSAAVFADWHEAFVEKGQDWKRWLADGALDAVVPMAYTADTAKFAQQIADAEGAASAAGRYCYAGIGAWHISADSALAKIDAARAIGTQGVVLFSYGGITRDGETTAYIGKVASLGYTRPASLPQMPWNAKLPSPNTQTALGTAIQIPTDSSPQKPNSTP